MKITLNKTVMLRTATVYMKIKKNVRRSDIQEYLKGKPFKESIIKKRIDEYLKEIKVYDENMQLTEMGHKVLQTGLLPTPEEGKYKIWYTNDDEYFGSVIMYFQRIAPRAKFDGKEMPLKLDGNGHFIMPSNEKNGDVEYAEFDLSSFDLLGTTHKETEKVDVKLVLEGEQCNICFYGSLGKDNWKINLDSTKGIERNEKIEQILSEALSDYSTEDKRLRVRFDPLKNEDCYKYFEQRNYQLVWHSFEGNIDSIKIMPYDDEDAKQWRNYLLRNELSEHYFSPEDFGQKASEINDKAGFDRYKNNLDVPKADEFDTGTQAEYWHLNAPMDLNPNQLFTNISEIITLKKNVKFSFAEIVSQLGVGMQNDIVVYYDKYVVDERKQKAAAALLDSIEASKKIIITDMSQHNQKSDFISTKRIDLRIRDLKTGIFAQKPAHDRYLIVASPKRIKIWVMTNSLDFIRFKENDVTPNTKGKIVQSATFTPLSDSTMDKELLNFVNNEKNGN